MNLEIVNRFFKSFYVQSIFFLLILFLLLPINLTSNYYLCEIEDLNFCVDQSWALSINWALQKQLIFGKDYVFTYGALGFLVTRADLGINHFYFIVFDLFIFLNLAFILVYIFKKFYGFQTVLFTALIAFILPSPVIYSENVVFVLLLISVFWLNLSIKHSTIWGLIVPTIITVLLFFIKVNISFIGIIIFYVYSIYFLITDKKNTAGKISFGLAAPLLILLLSFPLRTDIPGYIMGSLNLINGYNDAMLLNARENLNYTIIAAILIFIYLSMFFYKNIRTNILLFLTSGICSYVLFKQSFVRSDDHINTFFTLFPAFASILFIFSKNPTNLQKLAITLVSLCCLIIGLPRDIYNTPYYRSNYFNSVFSEPDSRAFENSFNRFKLPSDITETIGQKSIDVIPWNINYLYFNNLNYNPRPVIQSYSAYTPYLWNLNKQKYESNSAPEFVIFSNQTVDSRYAFFDDQPAKLNLLTNYTCKGLFNSQGNNFLLFQRSPNNATFEISAPVESIVKFKEDFSFSDPNKIYFVKADLDYSLTGEAVRFLYKPFQLIIAFTFADGSNYQHIALIPALRGGVLINPYIKDEMDFMNFANGVEPPDSKKIKSIKFIVNLPNPRARKLAAATYKNEIRISVSKVSVMRNNQH